MLTPKQEAFCKYILSGMSGKDAYIAAYNSKGSNQNAYNESSKLLAREDIQERLKILRKPLEEQARTTIISEREKKRAWLWDMIEHAANESDKLRAMDILNKMDSEYINIQRIEKEDTPMQDLDTKELIKLTRMN